MLQLRNPLYMHILSEILVLSCLVVWISGYRKRTTSQIEKLLLRIEEQDEKIQKLEQMFIQQQQQQLLSNLTEPFMFAPQPTLRPEAPKPKPVVVKPKPKPVVVKPTPIPTPVVQTPAPAPPQESIEAVEDLDELLQEELAELAQPSTAIEDISTDQVADLKKKDH